MTSQAVNAAAKTEPSRDDLLEILLRYNEATERLRSSHEALKGEVVRLRGELEEKNRELRRRQRLAMLGEMAAGMAHEIRNPLGGIMLCADMLRDDMAGSREALDILVRLESGVRILNRIVEDMLLFTRDLHVDAQPWLLADLVRSALDLASHDVRRSSLRVLISDWELDHWVRADGSLIIRSLLNLILNAAQAGETRPDASLRITAAPGHESNQVAIILEDTCGGIAAEDLDKIFDPFFTRRDKGTGLGLAIVHRTMEAHGGQIAAQNNRVGGATFTLTLPEAQRPDAPAAGDAGSTHAVCKER
ncbi:MAG TPA: ATP-binding protein [Phycisphaerae bacterium]|mgnify:CR=1 FL=1|nr:sensor histidine kinase [Phycisphaerae bacterium]HOI56724.1 ATP-binding protein [Phycisphaerae bacterium]